MQLSTVRRLEALEAETEVETERRLLIVTSPNSEPNVARVGDEVLRRGEDESREAFQNRAEALAWSKAAPGSAVALVVMYPGRARPADSMR